MKKIEKDFMLDGYRCVIVGHEMGHRCGYVGLPVGHKLYGIGYDDVDISVHGGLTYADGSRDSNYPVESELWWLGFDCAHCGDGKDFLLIKELADERTYSMMLEIERMYPVKETIRTTEYVENELIEMVEQLKAL